MTRFPKSYLFVPGDRPDRFEKAVGSGADRVILDLEDAVAPTAKLQARQAVHDWARARTEPFVVRVNAADGPFFADDLAMVATLPACDVMVPKSDPGVVNTAAGIARRPLIALVETVAGLISLRQTAAIPDVARIAFGNLDFSLDSGMDGSGSEMDFARAQIVLEARHAGQAPPIDGVTVSLADEAALSADLDRARRFGFGGKLCIHPLQVAATNARFSPSSSEVDWARRILDAAEASGGAAVAVDGKMVDRPLLQRAHAILAQAI